MGLLKRGKPLAWRDTVPHCQYIRDHGIRQFLATWARVHELQNDRLFYGDEIEYAILKVNQGERNVQISLRGLEIMEELTRREQHTQQLWGGCLWHPEYGSWMVEGTPAVPYGGYTSSLLQVEENMRLRRARLLSVLAPDEIAPTVVNFPMLGVGDYVHPPSSPGGVASESSLVSDTCINPHPRFGTLTANIRARRGRKVDIEVPLFQDRFTSQTESTIKMDCMAFGMGCCCLQVTFQASDVVESRYLYDQLATLAPIMLALTAATPIFCGKLADVDARWQTISASVDDRTQAEQGEPQASDGASPVKRSRYTHKSRYDSISCYISQGAHMNEKISAFYNDVPCEVDSNTKTTLEGNGIDGPLANHLAHLFIRDPLVAFDGSIQEVNDEESSEHFESINSTNWQTVRWKPPPPMECCAPHIGWRTEFRSMEVQLTDFENAAFTAFIVLVTRALLVFDLDLLIPLSKVDENMNRAHVPDAVNKCKFWFRKNIFQESTQLSTSKSPDNAPYTEMTMQEIMDGKNGYFPGLVPLCIAYLEHIGCDPVSFARIAEYLKFISKRASGKLITPATWMRRFVTGHKEYKQDSLITPGIAYDLMLACNEIGLGIRACPEVLGNVVIEPIKKAGAFAQPLESVYSKEAQHKLLDKLQSRALLIDGPRSGPTAPMRFRMAQQARCLCDEKQSKSVFSWLCDMPCFHGFSKNKKPHTFLGRELSW